MIRLKRIKLPLHSPSQHCRKFCEKVWQPMKIKKETDLEYLERRETILANYHGNMNIFWGLFTAICAVSWYNRMKSILVKEEISKMCTHEVMKELIFQVQAFVAADSPDIAEDIMFETEFFVIKVEDSEHYSLESHFRLRKSHKRFHFSIRWDFDDRTGKPRVYHTSAEVETCSYTKDSAQERKNFREHTLIPIQFDWDENTQTFAKRLENIPRIPQLPVSS